MTQPLTLALIGAATLIVPQVADARPAGISLAQARHIALERAPGHIVQAEREREGGAMRWSFDIRQGRRIHEIGVDVASGHVVEDKFEPANARD